MRTRFYPNALMALALVGCASGPIQDDGLADETDAAGRVPTWLEERPPIELPSTQPNRARRPSSHSLWFEGREERERREDHGSVRSVPQVNVREEIGLEMNRIDAVRRGHRLYRRACATCHGRRADGNGPSAAGLETAPASLTGGAFMYTSGDDETLNEELFQILSDGIESDMPGWKKLLSRRDRWSIVAFLRTL